jgi:hypothetical protein
MFQQFLRANLVCDGKISAREAALNYGFENFKVGLCQDHPPIIEPKRQFSTSMLV